MKNKTTTNRLLQGHHRIVPILFIVFGVPFVGFGLFLWLGTIATSDEPAPDDHDLRLPIVRVADADNAYIEINKLITLGNNGNTTIEQPPTDQKVKAMLRGESWDDAYATSIVASHRSEIDLLLAAAKKPQYQNPYYTDPNNLTTERYLQGYIGSPRLIAGLAALEAQQQAEHGNVQAALTEAMAITKVGNMMEFGQGPLIDYLIASAVKQAGLTAMRQIALDHAVPSEMVTTLVSELEQYRDSTPAVVTALKMEYAALRMNQPSVRRLGDALAQLSVSVDEQGNTRSPRNRVVDILDAAGVTTYYYRPNQSWHYGLNQARQHIAEAVRDCASLTSAEPAYTPLVRHGAVLIFEPNAVGKVLTDIGRVSYVGLQKTRCNESLAVSATQIVLASSAYRAENKMNPPQLTGLVPQFLPAVPLDPYGARAMAYRPELKYVYSIGAEHHDMGGSQVTPDWTAQTNPSFAIQ